MSAAAPTVATHRPRFSRVVRRRIGMTFAYAVLILWALFSVFPVLWTYTSSLKEPRDVFALPPKLLFTPTLYNYQVVLGLILPAESEGLTGQQAGAVRSKLPDQFLNTAIVSVGSTVLAMVVGCSAAYALARARMRGKQAILLGVLLTRLVPPVVLIVPMYMIWRNFRLIDTHVGLILAFFTFNLPFVIWMMRGFFLSLPDELEEAARIDGCSRLGAFWRIVLPLAAPGLAATALFVMLFAWNEFLIAAVLGGEKAKTLTPAIFGYVSDRSVLWGRLYAASSLIMLPVVLFALFIQRHIATGLTGGALKG